VISVALLFWETRTRWRDAAESFVFAIRAVCLRIQWYVETGPFLIVRDGVCEKRAYSVPIGQKLLSLLFPPVAPDTMDVTIDRGPAASYALCVTPV